MPEDTRLPSPHSSNSCSMFSSHKREQNLLAEKISSEINRLADEKLNLKDRIIRFISFSEQFAEIIQGSLKDHPIWTELLLRHSTHKQICPFTQQREIHLSPLTQLLGVYYNALGVAEENPRDALKYFDKAIKNNSAMAARNKLYLLQDEIFTEEGIAKDNGLAVEMLKDLLHKQVFLTQLETIAKSGSPAAAFTIIEYATYVLEKKIEDKSFILKMFNTAMYSIYFALTLTDKIQSEATLDKEKKISLSMENIYYGKNQLNLEKNQDGEGNTIVFRKVLDPEVDAGVINTLKQFQCFFEVQYQRIFPTGPTLLLTEKHKKEAKEIIEQQTSLLRQPDTDPVSKKDAKLSISISRLIDNSSINAAKINKDYEAWKTKFETPTTATASNPSIDTPTTKPP